MMCDKVRSLDRRVSKIKQRGYCLALIAVCDAAELAGGKLTLWSVLYSGTEVELIIAASRAYAKAWAPGRGVG